MVAGLAEVKSGRCPGDTTLATSFSMVVWAGQNVLVCGMHDGQCPESHVRVKFDQGTTVALS